MTVRTVLWLMALGAMLAGSAARAGSAAPAEEAHETEPVTLSVAMTRLETATFLAEPRVARLATVRANGTPQLTPMWFVWADGVVYMSTRTQAAKVKHIRGNPNVAVVIDVMDAPYRNRIVTIEGTADLMPDPDHIITKLIRRKYTGDERRPEGMPEAERIIIRVTPRKITAVNTGKIVQ